MICFTCHYCQAKVKAPERKHGKWAACPRCGSYLQVPQVVVDYDNEPPPIHTNKPTLLATEVDCFSPQEVDDQGRHSPALPVRIVLYAVSLFMLIVLLVLTAIVIQTSEQWPTSLLEPIQFVTATLLLCCLALAALTLYILPSLIAIYRDHQHKLAILVFNLFFGWSFIGWVLSLVWSLMEVTARVHKHYHYHD